MEKGIEADRLEPVGYGKAEPVIVDEKMHEQYTFLPIGQTLNEEFILSLPKEQQSVADQINRRTTFSVTSLTYGL